MKERPRSALDDLAAARAAGSLLRGRDPEAATPSEAGPASAGPAGLPAEAVPLVPHVAANPLIEAGAELLDRAALLASGPDPGDLQTLRRSLIDAVQRFDAALAGRGMAREQRVGGRYLLCALLDEIVSRRPWRQSADWTTQGLLLHFHQERDGSDRVFHLLSRLQQDPRRHRHLLELMQAVFDLGFQGRYGQMTGGARQLEALRQRLASQLPAAGTAARPKSAAAQRGANAVTARPRRPRLWVWIPVALATLLLGLVLAYGWHDARPEASAGFSREAGPATPASVTGPALDSAPAGPRLRGLLKSDLDSGRVELQELADHSTLMLRGDRLFGAESADLLPAAAPLLARIGDALRQFPGRVVISGHTDNLPIHTERFPSNWHLSKERASSVKRALAEQLAAGRLAVEGRADTEPVADNGAPEGRAMNSRIEITLHAPASVSAP